MQIPQGFRLLTVALVALLLAGCGSKPSPAPSPSTSPGPAASVVPLPAVYRTLLAAWEFDQARDRTRPSLKGLTWQPLKAGMRLSAPCLVLTGRGTTVKLSVPETVYMPYFRRTVEEEKVIGYRLKRPEVLIEISANTFYPFRFIPDVHVRGSALGAVVKSVRGVAMVSTDARLEKDLARQGARTRRTRVAEQGAASPQAVRVKKGLGFRGKDVASLDADTIRSLGLPDRSGVYVDAVFPGSPAMRAGIRTGDVIRKMAGRRVGDALSLSKALDGLPTGRAVSVVLYRPQLGAERTVQVKLGAFEGN